MKAMVKAADKRRQLGENCCRERKEKNPFNFSDQLEWQVIVSLSHGQRL